MKKNETTAVSDQALLYQKIVRIMKLTLALLLIACLQVSAKGWSQERITLKMTEAEIKKVLFAIEKKSDYRFLFSEEAIKGKPRVNVDVVEAPLTDVLDRILANTGVSYKILGSNLVVLKENVTAADILVQDVRVTGRVTSAAGEPLAGVSVSVKGTRTGTTTDAAGNFALTVPDDAVLVFSSVGYEPMEIAVAGKTTVNASLVESAKKIDEVVVIGYGTANKRDLTGSITKIAGKDVADKPNTNPVSSLQGKVAGLSVVNTGVPGTQPDVRIRGTISIGSVKPLYVVDGIFTDNIENINPNDIESIEILKDPSSLAIFGVFGAPGVIAVTTKRAKAGQILINLNSTVGWKKLVDKIELTNAEEFKMLLAEEGVNRFNETGATAINDFVATQLPTWNGNTDWVDALTRTAFFNANNLSLSASTEKNRLYMGLGYNTDEGLVKNVKYERLQITLNDEFKASKAIKLGFGLIGSREKLPYGNAIGQLAQAKRVAPIVPAGTINLRGRNPYGTDSANYDYYYATPIIQNTVNNPLMELENNWDKVVDYKYRMIGNIFAEITFLRHFTARATLYADLSSQDRRTYTPLYDVYNPEIPGVDNVNTLTGVNQFKEEIKKFQQDYTLTFKKNFNDHNVTAVAGFTTFYTYLNNLTGDVKQKIGSNPIPDDDRFWYISNGFGDVSSQRSNSYAKEAATVSGLARVLYNYKQKYFLNASFRRDGSSLIYNPETRSQNFWAVGAAWELTKEGFMDGQRFFDYLKLKGSIGVLGNQNTYNTDYPYFPGLAAGATAVFGNQVFPSYAPNYNVSEDLKWESVKAIDIGFEFNALRNRLHVEAAYYNKKTRDMWAYLRVIGVNPTLGNLGSVTNKGFELSATWDQKLATDLTLSLSGNITTYDNVVTSLATPLPADEQFPNQTSVGMPIGYFYGYVVEGVYQSYADKLASPVFTEFAYGPGDLKYKDINGDGQINADDKTMIGNPTPDFTYGGSVNLIYKNWNLGVDVVGVYGNEIYRYWMTSENIFSIYNYPKYALDRWHGEGTSNWVPILDQTHKVNRVASSYGIEDGSYFRIRNVQVGYNFPAKMIEGLHLKSARLFANIQNLKTWRRNLGYSPEFAGTATNGQPATSFGIDVGDANSTIPIVYTFGFNVNF